MSRRAPLALIGTTCALTVIAAAIALGSAHASSCAPGDPAALTGACRPLDPVASLEPRETDRLWRQVSQRARPLSFGAQADCRPARVVFYAANDWLRLATTLATNASSCTDYYVSVPPLTSDKTRPRANQAQLIRALGPRFHALAEIHMGGWRAWVNANGSSWREAGIEARRRMAAAGYDVALGDTWAVNEFSSAVRRGTGAARTEARDFVRGLFEGDGVLPQARGVVFSVGVAQNVPDLRDYRARLQTWMLDQAFWVDMNAFVSDWSNEVYGDARSYGVPGAPLETRRKALNDYLQHQFALARQGPPEAGAARTYLERAHSPLANAAWQWPAKFGFTAIPNDQMASYVSAQTYALRSYASTNGAVDRFGFAWAPRNLDGLATPDFARQTRDLLERLAVAIRDSGEAVDPADPGIGACGPRGTNLWCATDVTAAKPAIAWSSFATWVQAALVFTTAPQTLPVGVASGPITLQLQQGRFPVVAETDLPVVLSTDSPQGQLAVTADGPWSPTLTLTIPAGGSTAPPFFYRDTRAGASAIRAAYPGFATGTQTVTLIGGPPVGIFVEPQSVSVVAGTTQVLQVRGRDAFGNVVPALDPAWALAPGTPGVLSATTGSAVTFTGVSPGRGSVIASATVETGRVTASADVVVSPQPVVRIGSIRYTRIGTRLRIDVTTVDADGATVPRAAVSVLVRRNGGRHLVASRRTGLRGATAFRPAARPGCFTTRVTRVVAAGYRWTGKTPTNRFCIAKPAKQAKPVPPAT